MIQTTYKIRRIDAQQGILINLGTVKSIIITANVFDQVAAGIRVSVLATIQQLLIENNIITNISSNAIVVERKIYDLPSFNRPNALSQ